MEHSVEAYLQRVPTEKLVRFLNDYQQGIITEPYDDTLPYIIAALEKRKMESVSEPEQG